MEVDKVLLPLPSGPTLILPRHAPLLAALKCGKVITTTNGEDTTYFISSGIAEVRRDICALCAWGIAQKDVHVDEIKNQVEDLEKVSTHSTLEKQIKADLITFF